ncbi:MAG: glycosyltransferase [Scytonema sp. PMC 1069.18]|nr:glycosyltransferase [Scytonema sp. PMC 1069.18]MEC4880687.1 glycosyltransferase [Scytonema sp. PMC 1070.18]
MKENLINFRNKPIKIQILSRQVPVENSAGNAAYLLDFINYLQQAGYEIEYTLVTSSPNGKIPWYIIPSRLAELANVSARDNLRIGRRLLKSKFFDWLTTPVWLAYMCLPENAKNIYRFARDKQQQTQGRARGWDAIATSEEVTFVSSRFVEFKPDVVIANYAFLGNLLDSPTLDDTVLKVILTHDVRHQRTADFKKLGAIACESDWSREKEAIQLSKADILLAIQEEDAKVFQEMVPQCEVIHAPMSAVCHTHTTKQVPGRCLFVGSSADHNLHALQWFLKNVWPLVLQSVPHCNLHVCGTVCNKIEETFPNVRLLGRVNDLKPEYSSAEVCVVPLTVGSGLKIKLVEALAHGRASVSTSVGVQGLREIVGNAVLVADTAEDFATAIHTLLTHPEKRQSMEEQARQYTIEKLSPKAAYQPFVDRIEQHLKPATNKNTKHLLTAEL